MNKENQVEMLLSPSEKIEKFKDIVENEVDFFKVYFEEHLEHFLYDIREKSRGIGLKFTEANDIWTRHAFKHLSDPEKKKLFGSTRFSNKDASKKKYYKIFGKVSNRVNFGDHRIGEDDENKPSIRLRGSTIIYKDHCFGIIELLDYYLGQFRNDIGEVQRLLAERGELSDFPGETVLRLSLWSSVFTNDEYGQLSPLGPIMIYVGEAMGHQPIAILDALDQVLWSGEYLLWTNTDKLKEQDLLLFFENLWRLDLIRAQLLVNSVMKRFYDFIKNTEKSIPDIVDNWKKCFEELIELDVLNRQISKDSETDHNDNLSDPYRSKLLYDKLNDITQTLKADDHLILTEKMLDQVWDSVRNITNFKTSDNIDENEKLKKEEEIFNGFFVSLKNELKEELKKADNSLNSLFRSTFFHSRCEHPPLIQMIHGAASSWVSENEIPGIIVINRDLATDFQLNNRLKAYAAVPHELGHIISGLFRNDRLIESYREAIIGNPEINNRDMWRAWISEVFADAVGVGLFHINAINGLKYALARVKTATFAIKESEHNDVKEHYEKYDSHTTPLIRVKLLISFLEKFKEIILEERNASNQVSSQDTPKSGRLDFLTSEIDKLKMEWEVWTSNHTGLSLMRKAFDKVLRKGKEYNDINTLFEALASNGMITVYSNDDVDDNKVSKKELRKNARLLGQLYSKLMNALYNVHMDQWVAEVPFKSMFEKFVNICNDSELLSKPIVKRKIYNEVENRYHNISDFESDIGEVITLLCDTSCKCFGGKTFEDLLKYIWKFEADNSFIVLSSSYTDHLLQYKNVDAKLPAYQRRTAS